jgi:hypothetical protein
MAPPNGRNSPHKEGRIALAIHSLQKNQVSSQHKAANVYGAIRTTMRRRQEGILPKQGSKAKNRLLLECEEQQLVSWILSMERRGFPPFLIDIKRMA